MDETAEKAHPKALISRQPAPRRRGQTLPMDYVDRGSMMFARKATKEKDFGRVKPWGQRRIGVEGQILTVVDGVPLWRDPPTQNVKFEKETLEW